MSQFDANLDSSGADLFAGGHANLDAAADIGPATKRGAVWALALLASACALAAAFAEFGVRRDMADFSAAQAEALRKMATATRAADDNQTLILSRLGSLESAQANLSLTVQKVRNEMRGEVEALQTHMQAVDQKFEQMDLRLTRIEDSERSNQANAAANETIVARSSEAAKPDKVLTRFGIVRLTGQSAWIAGPEGWFHVAVGDKLPGDVKVLEIGKVNSRRAVFTDKGTIFSAQ